MRALLLANHANKFGGLLQSHLLQGDGEAAFATLERARARSMLEMLTDRDVDITADASPEWLRQQEALDSRLAETSEVLTSLAAMPENAARSEELLLLMYTLTRQREEAGAHLRACAPRPARYPQLLTCQAAQQLLKPGMLLSYFVDETQTVLFALTREQPLITFALPFGRRSLQERVRLFVRSLNQSEGEQGESEMERQSQACTTIWYARHRHWCSRRRVFLSAWTGRC